MTHARRVLPNGPRVPQLGLRLAALGVLATLAVGAWALADATMYRGGGGLTGSYAEKIAVPMALEWRFTASLTPYNPSSPAVSGADVFYAAGNRIYCVDAESGAMKWRYPQDGPLQTSIYSSPAVAEGVVYFGAGDGKLYALQASDGTYAWAFDTKSNIGSSPTVVDGIIYFGSLDGRVWAIDSKTRDSVPAWKGGVKTSDEITGAPAVANGIVYALSLDQQLHAIGQTTGKARYVVRAPASVFGMSPVAVGEYVFVANGANINCYMGRNLLQKWFLPLPTDVAVPPAANDQNLFVVTTDNMVYALDQRTGKPKWKTSKKLDFDVVAPPTLAGNTLLLGTSAGTLVAMDAESGNIKWTYKVQAATNNTEQIARSTRIAAAPVVSKGTLYVVSDDGSLNAFRADSSDGAAPVISDLEPDAGLVVNGEPPFHFEAKIVDEGSGVNPDSLKISLDGEAAPRRPEGEAGIDKSGFRYDITTDLLEYDVLAPVGASAVRPLPNGKHTITISAADWRGNLATKTWSFTVDNTIARKLARKRAATNTGTGGSGRPGGAGSGKGGGGGAAGSGG